MRSKFPQEEKNSIFFMIVTLASPASGIESNSIAALAPWVRPVWESPYFRGALSGLGLVNIYISLGEVFRLRRPRADRLKVPVL